MMKDPTSGPLEQLPDGWMSPLPDTTWKSDLFLIGLFSFPAIALAVVGWLHG